MFLCMHLVTLVHAQYSRSTLKPSLWPGLEEIEVDVDEDLLRMIAEAENREFALLSKEYSGTSSSTCATSPFDSGGVSPLSSGPPTPTQPTPLDTQDILHEVSAVLERIPERCGAKRSRDNEDADAHEPSKLSRKARRAAERAEFRTAKRREEALKKDVLTQRVADVRPSVEERYQTARAIQASFVVAALAIARSGYTGINRPADTIPYDFDDLVNRRKFKYVKIDATKP